MEMPKEYGALGFISIKVKNRGLLAKWWWKFSDEISPLWKRVVKSTYVITNNFASTITLHNISGGTFSYIKPVVKQWPWVQDILENGLVIEVGDGKIILFYHDSWVGQQPLKSRFPRLFSLSRQQVEFISDVGSWNHNFWEWKLKWRRRMFSWENKQLEALETMVNGCKPKSRSRDRVTWKDGGNTAYTVRSLSLNAMLIYITDFSVKK